MNPFHLVIAQHASIGDLRIPVRGNPSLVGATVVIRLRPEQCDENQRDAALDIEISVVERLGGESLIYASADRKQFCTSLSGSVDLTEGSTTQIHFNLSDCHVFDKTGTALERLRGPGLN